jgi:hypothetical protein
MEPRIRPLSHFILFRTVNLPWYPRGQRPRPHVTHRQTRRTKVIKLSNVERATLTPIISTHILAEWSADILASPQEISPTLIHSATSTPPAPKVSRRQSTLPIGISCNSICTTRTSFRMWIKKSPLRGLSISSKLQEMPVVVFINNNYLNLKTRCAKN